MKRRLDLSAYFPKQGNEKAYYRRIGNLFIDEDGRISLKIDLVPVGNRWEGWCNAFENDASTLKSATPSTLSEDDIPF